MQGEDARIYTVIQELVRRSGEFSNRLRTVEQRLEGIEARLASVESTNLERVKKYNSKFVEIDVTLRNLNDEILRIKNSIEKINRQTGKFAIKRDVQEVEKMIELLAPVNKSVEE